MRQFGEIKRSVESGELDAAFGSMYRRSEPESARVRYLSLMETFANRFGESAGTALFSTPGRTEIGGNHTDHQHGCVLAGSVDMDIAAVAAPNGLQCIRMLSEGFPEQEVALDRLSPNPDEFNDSRALIRGIAAQFVERGYPVGGFDACLASTVLKGSGLSSSAAFEVMVGTIVNHLFAGGAEPMVEIAKIGRYAENVFFGKPCGLMDQLACAVGGVLSIDFENIDSPAIEKVEFDFLGHGYALCIIDSGADHSDMTDEYSPIPLEMRQVAEHFGKEYLRAVRKEDILRELPALRKKAGDRAVLRALHFFNDSERAVLEARALAGNRIDEFLALVNESGKSSSEYLQNIYACGSSRHQEVNMVLALCAEFLGGQGAYRVHGGGFAGTVQAFVPVGVLEGFRSTMEVALGQGRCHILQVRNEGGIRLA